ncbi:MAG: hypothetical protein AAGF12_24230 [Myxococcota bacterium]
MRGSVAIWVLALAGVTGCTTGGDDEAPEEDAAVLFPDATPDATPDGAPVVRDECDPDRPLPEACDVNADCSDGCFCNGAEQCVAGVCQAGADPCTDDVECTSHACLEETDQCFIMPEHERCANDDACDGRERCDTLLGCVAGEAPYCNDESSCTFDSCETATGCNFVPRDLDNDGFVSAICDGTDCDDDPRFGAMIYPGAPEDCRNRRDDNCDGLRDFNDPTCVATNDTCATAEILPGPGTYSGSTSGLSGNYELNCRTSGGPDAVFRINVPMEMDVQVTLAGGGNGAGVSVRPWDQCDLGPDDKCSAANPPTFLRRSAPAGDYAILVQSSTPGAAFDINVRFSPPTPIPPVDECNATTTDVSAGGTFTGLFSDVEDDYQLSCHTSSVAKDAVYRFTTTGPKDVTITASTSGAMWPPQTYISLVTDCTDTETTVRCVNGSAAELRARELPAGTYFILLQSSANDATNWTMDVTITDPVPRLPADACSTAVDITAATGMAMWPMLEGDGGTSCGGGGSSGRDAFFYFDVAALSDALVTTNGGGFHYSAVSTSCGAVASELRCISGSDPRTQLFRSLAPGRYYVTVARNSSFGDVSASVTLSPPTPIPPNDLCSGAVALTNGMVRNDTVLGFADDVRGFSGSSRPDSFYRLDLTARSNLTVTVTPTTLSGFAYLTLRDSCAGPMNIVGDSGSPAVITQDLDPGTYYLIVESSSFASAGDYTIRSFITPL